jgi:hypothetical protein
VGHAELAPGVGDEDLAFVLEVLTFEIARPTDGAAEPEIALGVGAEEIFLDECRVSEGVPYGGGGCAMVFSTRAVVSSAVAP